MILRGDALKHLVQVPDEYFQTCITSPPYWGLRDYGVDGQMGLEKTPDEYVAKLVSVFREVRRVLAKDGTLWLNLGDSYAQGGSGGVSNKSKLNGGKGVGPNEKLMHMQAKSFSRKAPEGLKPKDLVGIPWRVAFALQQDGWYLRQDIIWHKPNPMPESVRDRCTKAHEYIFLLAKSQKYYFDSDAVKEKAVCPEGPRNKKAHKKFELQFTQEQYSRTRENVHKIGPRETRNRRSVWTVTTKPFKGAHFATFPQDLIEPCVLAGSASGDYVLDPFAGAGTTGVVCKKHGRKFVGIELNEQYAEMADKRIDAVI